MCRSIVSHLRGIFSLFIYFLNTIFWTTPLFIVALCKLLIPLPWFRKFCDRLLSGLANNWVGVNNLTQRLFCNIRWHVSGLDVLRSQGWYLVVANHQSWVDILVLQNIFHRKIPFLKFFLKKELFWFPIMGQAWWALDFPFMKRYSKSYLKKHPHRAGQDLEITKKACEKFKTIPVSIMNFAEGTRFTRTKHRRQRSPHENLLRPKAGGLAFALAAMGEHLHSFLDVTIAYPGGTRTFWDFLCGNINDIRVQIRALPITEEMMGDYHRDRHFRRAFQNWLNALWQQKDRCIGEMLADPRSDTPAHGPAAPWSTEPMPALKRWVADSSVR